MTRTVTLTWNEPKNRWDMAYKGEFIMDFPPCHNMTLFFRPSKKKVSEYKLTIEKVKSL